LLRRETLSFQQRVHRLANVAPLTVCARDRC